MNNSPCGSDRDISIDRYGQFLSFLIKDEQYRDENYEDSMLSYNQNHKSFDSENIYKKF